MTKYQEIPQHLKKAVSDSGLEFIFDGPSWNDRSSILGIGLEEDCGGASGGNCWGDDAHGYSNPVNIDTDQLVLAAIALGLLDENISVKDFLNFKKKYIETSERTEYEYYGNYTNYLQCFIKTEIIDGKLSLRE